MKTFPLTPAEQQVIEKKRTEAPYSGEYENFVAEGWYLCRKCHSPLYRSENKFDARCGWPSFDQEISATVQHLPDPDGQRTEVRCAYCDGHLGHVFVGEEFTSTNTRHCVNSSSLIFVSKDHFEVAYFGGGCFWCTETIFAQLKGVLQVAPGYAGGQTDHPTYEQVCSGQTGHAEVVRVIFDPQLICYQQLLDIFFHTHNPTTLNQQGHDRGTAYRSIILTTSAKQQEEADSVMTSLNQSGEFTDPIVTEVQPAKRFFLAEAEHRDFFTTHPEAVYCQVVIQPKTEAFRKRYRHLLDSPQI